MRVESRDGFHEVENATTEHGFVAACGDDPWCRYVGVDEGFQNPHLA
jgi:hypothetical protein